MGIGREAEGDDLAVAPGSEPSALLLAFRGSAPASRKIGHHCWSCLEICVQATTLQEVVVVRERAGVHQISRLGMRKPRVKFSGNSFLRAPSTDA